MLFSFMFENRWNRVFFISLTIIFVSSYNELLSDVDDEYTPSYYYNTLYLCCVRRLIDRCCILVAVRVLLNGQVDKTMTWSIYQPPLSSFALFSSKDVTFSSVFLFIDDVHMCRKKSKRISYSSFRYWFSHRIYRLSIPICYYLHSSGYHHLACALLSLVS